MPRNRRLPIKSPALQMTTVLADGGVRYETPAYTNAGGTGDRTGIITVTTTCSILGGDISLLVDGVTAGGMFFNEQDTTGLYIRFDFGASVIVQDFRFYKVAGYAGGYGNWKGQVSQNASDWTDVSSSFTLGAGAGTPIEHLLGNTNPGRYFQILGLGTNMPAAEYYCFEFKIGNLL